MKRLLPSPGLTLILAAIWVLLFDSVSPGVVLFGLLLGVLIPLFTARFWSGGPPIRSYPKAISYVLLVVWDIVVANVQVAYLILFKRNDELHSLFVTIPLDLREPEAITILAGTITMTPGTVSADLSADGRALLVHCLSADDAEGVVSGIKTRYEARLKEIFG
jgi:multicomponent K+:H+ antiporter subunit E